MRLINCSTLQLEDFFDSNIPDYAILSHCWGKDEVLFADLTLNLALAKSKQSWRKIDYTCKQAIQDGLNYAWVDTCCIDKSSSAELSEAINSMFRWYEGSTACYVYLSDVFHTSFETDFPASRWFTRGWTLQELLAPSHVIFYDCAWNPLGTKEDHASRISDITTIDVPVLLRPNKQGQFKLHLRQLCAAKKMSWASRRNTTRLEDAAYCLLGIFNINMPLLYGEGTKAFHRLQEEIIKISNDDSILAWDLDTAPSHPRGLVPEHVEKFLERTRGVGPYLAASPKDFEHCGKLQFGDRSSSIFTTTNHGLQIQLPLLKILQPPSKQKPGWQKNILAWLGLLSCSTGSSGECLAIVLAPTGRRVDDSKKFERLRLSKFPDPCSTITVGPRVAFESEVEKIMISRIDGTHQTEARYSGYYQVLITETYNVRKEGYHILDASRERIATAPQERVYKTTWDPVAMMLTTDARNMFGDLLSFGFASTATNGDPGFTVFLNPFTQNAMILEGRAFSPHERLKCRDMLEVPKVNTRGDRIHESGLNKLSFWTAKGRELHVSFEVKEKKVYGWRILDVKVDITSCFI